MIAVADRIRRPLVRTTLVGLAVLFVAASAATPALGLCATPPSLGTAIRAAELVFVGTVRAVDQRRTEATVAVGEIWRGPDLPPTVTVHGSPGGPGTVTSVDRTYSAGVTYLFVLHSAERPLRESACSSTTEWRNALAALRPSDARLPSAAPSSLGEIGLPLLWLGLGVATLGLVSAIAFRRTRPG